MWLLKLSKWFRREEGQDLTEYALIIALIVIAAVVAIRLLGTSISGVLSEIATTMSGVLGGT
jgi:Flp pilus assembly pilin Flp